MVVLQLDWWKVVLGGMIDLVVGRREEHLGVDAVGLAAAAVRGGGGGQGGRVGRWDPKSEGVGGLWRLWRYLQVVVAEA